MDRKRLEKIAVGLNVAEDNLRSILRSSIANKKAPPEGGA
jgi:hypothetical protein